MTAGFKPMFALRLEIIKEIATLFQAEIAVHLTLDFSNAIGSVRDIFTCISNKSKMSASQRILFPFFLSLWFLALKATGGEIYHFL